MSEISGRGQLSLTCSQWAGDITCWKGSPLDPTALAATCSQFAIPGPSARHLHTWEKSPSSMDWRVILSLCLMLLAV